MSAERAFSRARFVEKWSALLFLAASLSLVAYFLTDYGINWVRSDVFSFLPQWRIRHEIIFSGPEPLRPATVGWLSLGGAVTLGSVPLNWHELGRYFFDCLYNDCGRGRFLAYLFFHLDQIFRVWLVGYLPPHPGLSLTLFVSFISLYFLHRTIFALTRDRMAARLAVGLYALSEGFLSPLLMMTIPAKAFANSFVIFCLFLATRIWQSCDWRAYSTKAVVLYIALLLTYCTDETAWFIVGALPIMFPSLLQRRHLGLAIYLLSTFALYLAFVTWLAPIATTYYWPKIYPTMDFWAWTFNLGSAATRGAAPTPWIGSLLAQLDLRTILSSAWNILRYEFAWPHLGGIASAASVLPFAVGIGAAAARASTQLRWRLARAIILLVLFAIYDGLVLSRLITVPNLWSYQSNYYYGALVAVFSVVVIGITVGCFRGMPAARAACILAACYLGWVSCANLLRDNREEMDSHEALYAHMFEQDGGRDPFTPGTTLTLAKVLKYWRAAQAGEDLTNLRAAFSPRDVWLFELMDHNLCTSRACCIWPQRLERYCPEQTCIAPWKY